MKRVLPIMAFVTITAASCKTSGTTDCIDPDKINPDAICTMQYEPVCGCDGETYGNACEADKAGVTSYTKGPCASN